MHEEKPRRKKSLCAGCQYPLLRLDGFEGTSSRNAPVLGDRSMDTSPEPILLVGFAAVPWLLLRKLWRAHRGPSRQKQVERLRADILPEAPDAMICPQCLRVAFPDEL